MRNLMHEFFDYLVENPLPSITLIEPIHIFIQIGMEMLGRTFMVDASQPVLKLHDLFVKLFQSGNYDSR